jgi:hypothetical protein
VAFIGLSPETIPRAGFAARPADGDAVAKIGGYQIDAAPEAG